MRKKQKNFLFKLYYEDFKMPDKMNYIKGIMMSCESKKQLDATLSWGKKVLWNYSDMINRRLEEFGSSTWFYVPACFSIINRTKKLSEELDKVYKEKKDRVY